MNNRVESDAPKPRAGRRAFICLHRKNQEFDCLTRRFMAVGEPECPEHGRSMVRQANHPYMGQEVPDG